MADKTIRVNDPLTVGGYTFHQNGFGPAPDVVIRDQAGKPLWTGPIAMTDSAAGFPLAEFAVPGRDVALQLLLQRASDGTGILLVLPFRSVGTNADGTPNVVGLGAGGAGPRRVRDARRDRLLRGAARRSASTRC